LAVAGLGLAYLSPGYEVLYFCAAADKGYCLVLAEHDAAFADGCEEFFCGRLHGD